MITAFYGDQRIKDAVLAQVCEHRRRSEIIQGTYWNGQKGCNLGCIAHIDDNKNNIHRTIARLLGLPPKIPYLLDCVFEGLPLKDAKNLVVKSIEAIPVGADLSLFHHHQAVWLLDPNTGINTITKSNRESIAFVRSLHAQVLDGRGVTPKEWRSARSAAESSAWSSEPAARSAESAAWSAWRSARSSARSAESSAWSAESSARSAESAAWSDVWKKIARKTIQIFRNSPVVACESCEVNIRKSLKHFGVV